MSVMDEADEREPQAPQPEKQPEHRAALPPWLRGRPARWAGGLAVAVLIACGAVAVADHHGLEFHDDGAVTTHRPGHDGTHADRAGGRDGERGDGRSEAGPGRVPAPLPSLDAADAVVKASSGVPAGKVESLRPVTAAGGGRAWQAVVLGPDGVRHLVTVDGATDTITGNTVLGG
ncbi:hypothetical protein AB0K51_34295 [Kitasatospora sp. NPDC049285]|uniref:hypothetical protein n=1 Tax=Kitasatospora sp. NPDC049285 TaxID=3157096 RepID=UPI0034353658